ncbi:hypothetical protein [Streptomyces brasiliscabiei]
MTHVFVVAALIVVVAALLCGHQAEDLPPFAARALRAVLRRTNHPRSNR